VKRARTDPNGEWRPAAATDCRSPCPALNTLANHGLLPRDGKNIDYDMLKHALIDIYALGPAFGTIFAHSATKKFANPATHKFSLCDLLINVHSSDQASKSTGIEHSASLSREDRPTTSDWSHKLDYTQRSPNQNQIDIVMHSSKTDMITLPDFVHAREALWMKSFAARPALKSDKLSTQEHVIANVEGCLFLGALSGNSNQGKFQISKTYAQSILRDERLPPGWKKTSTELGIPQLLSCLSQQGFAWAKSEFAGMLEISKHWFGLGLL